jgi:uncharacterized membrane protein YdfJ with MMPL/SSD domain
MTPPSSDRRPGLLGRLASSSARHPFRTLTAWVLILGTAIALAIVGVTGEDLFDRLGSDGGSWSNGESSDADELLTGEDAESTTLLVYGIDPADTDLAEIVADLGERLADIPDVSLTSPLAVPPLPDGSPDPRVAGLLADDGDGVLIIASVSTDTPDMGTAMDGVVEELRATAADIRDDFPASVAEVGSSDLLVHSIIEISESDLQRGEAVALPIALLVMLVVFGGFLAAGMPLVGAMVSIVGGLGALFGFTYLLDVNTTVVNVVTAVGLGLSIDYGLLIVSRFREEYRADAAERTREHRVAAIVRTAETAGRTVAFSGVTFAIAGAGLLFFEPAIVKAIGLGALSVTVISIASALTLLPALLALSGERLVRPGLLTRLPGVGRLLVRFGDIAPDEGFFSKLTRRLQRHPAIVTLAAFAVLLIMAAPVLSLRLANTAVDSIPASSDQHTFITTLTDHFPQATAPRVALVTRTEADALDWAEKVAQLDNVESVGDPVSVGDVWRSTVVVEKKTGSTVVGEIRADRSTGRLGDDHWVTGTDARAVDFSQSLVGGIPWAALVIALGTVLLLFLMTGSLVIPLKALLASALSLGASIGLLVWGFQDGAFAGLMGFDPDTVYGVDTLVVLLTFVFGFGLAMDYEMFILSRVKERRDAGASDTEAIALGLQRSGRIITSAALIIIVVFAGFATGDLMIIKQLGVALAFAVLLDATIVRCLLVPAFMTWQRRIMWWAPRWMKRLHARFGLLD